MGIVPIDLQTQGNWEQLFRGNYSKGLRTFKSILEVPSLAEQLIKEPQALTCIYVNVNFVNATGLLAKAIGESQYCKQAFNSYCGIRGINIGATFEATCANEANRLAIFKDAVLCNIIGNTPTLKAIYQVPAFTFENIKASLEAGTYAIWPLGSHVTIDMTAFSVNGINNAAGTWIFELVGIDEDVTEKGEPIPLSFVTRDVGASFVMNSSNSNTFTASAAYGAAANNSMFNALPAAWRELIKPARKIIASGNNTTTVGTYNFNCWFLKECEVQPKRTYSVQAEADATKQYSGFATGICNKAKNTKGTTSKASWWLWSAYQGNTTRFCCVNTDGSANYTNANASHGLCFGFAVGAPE